MKKSLVRGASSIWDYGFPDKPIKNLKEFFLIKGNFQDAWWQEFQNPVHGKF